MSSTTGLHAAASDTSAVVRGHHPLRGYPVTWRITPLRHAPGASTDFLVEQADGHLDDEDAWNAAERSETVMTSGQVRELIDRVTGR
jgi:hypothetical protein